MVAPPDSHYAVPWSAHQTWASPDYDRREEGRDTGSKLPVARGEGVGCSPWRYPPESPAMKQRAVKWLKFLLRWGIAVVGIWWVISQMYFRDRVWILDEKNHPVAATLSAYPDKAEQSAVFEIYDPQTYQRRVISRRE